MGKQVNLDVTHYTSPALFYREKLAPELDAVKEKEDGCWSTLSNEEQIALYRAQFVDSISEAENKPTYNSELFMAICAAIGVSVGFLLFARTYIAPTLPPSITAEWKEASKEKMRLYRM